MSWLTSSNASNYALFDYSGASTTAPIDAFAMGAGSNSVSIVALSISPNGSNDTLFDAFFSWGNGSSFTPPSSMNTRYNSKSASSGGNVVISDQYLSASGATGTRTTTASADTVNGFSLAIQPQ